MSSDYDHVLHSLERQVMDLSMTNRKDSIQVKTRQPMRSTSTRRSRHGRQENNNKNDMGDNDNDDDDDDDDDDIIGHLLQSPTFPSSIPKTIHDINQQHAKPSPKKIGLARSLSAGARKFPKKLLPNEPVPCMPTTTTITDDQRDAEDLQQALQLAWAVLDAEPSDEILTDSAKTTTTTITTTGSSNSDTIKREVTKQASSTQHQGTTLTIKTMTTRIFIEDAKNHKTVQLTNVLTTAMVIQYLKRKDLIDNSDEWTLFEIANSHGVERPLRQWEIVMDITCCWEQKTNNALLVKKYGFYDTLTMNTIRDRPSPVHGYLNIEYKKGKWQKRYCFIKDHTIYHAKDSNKSSNAAILCHLATYDVYTLLKPCSTSPTPFVFALRAQDRAANFEKEEDYRRLMTAENQACLETWVLGIRQAKSFLQYQQNSKIVMNPLASITVPPSSTTTTTTTAAPENGDQGLRRHKSTKRETGPEETNTSNNDTRPRGMSRSDSSTRRITDETIKRKASARGLSRNGTTRNRDHHSHQHEFKDTITGTGITGDEGNTTLIQIDDRVQFSKGSLLDKNNMAPTASQPNTTSATTTTTTTTAAAAAAAAGTGTAGPAAVTAVTASSSVLTSSSAPSSATATAASGPTSTHHHHHHHHHQQSSNSRTAMSRSKSTRETSSNNHHPQHRSKEEGVLSHHTSIRRKERGLQQQQQPQQPQQQQHDVPLPNTKSIMNSSASLSHTTDTTLLQLNNTPERFHTQTLLQRQMKPLLNFDQDITLDRRR